MLLTLICCVFQLSMDETLHLSKQMIEAETPHGRRREDSLLNMLTETLRRLEAVRGSRGHHDGAVGGRRCTGEGGEEIQRGSEEGTVSPAEGEKEGGEGRRSADEEREEKECKQKVLGVLRELSAFHSGRVAAWRGVLRECAHMLAKSPPGGSDQQHPPTTGM